MGILRVSEANELQQAIHAWKLQGFTICFVPTMGALHSGHLSLVKAAAGEKNKVVCSLFVNPTQFNESADFERYPRDVEKDIRLLQQSACDLVFTPEVKTIYPDGLNNAPTVDLQGIDLAMEGKHRPGHFKGVVQVVSRLFELVQPDRACFGLKDYQQYRVIENMTAALHLPVEIIGVPTLREEDGLAMSSRNTLLSEEERMLAPVIFAVLTEAKERYLRREPIAHIRILAEERLVQIPGARLDYFEIATENDLLPVHDTHPANARAFVAVFLGPVRLIDNLALHD